MLVKKSLLHTYLPNIQYIIITIIINIIVFIQSCIEEENITGFLNFSSNAFRVTIPLSGLRIKDTVELSRSLYKLYLTNMLSYLCVCEKFVWAEINQKEFTILFVFPCHFLYL